MSSDPRWLLMKEIYFAAVALQGQQRAAYLRENCPDEAMIREVEKLLSESTESATSLDTLDELIPPNPSPSDGPDPVLSPGTKLGHYVIRQKLGAGGMGLVYEATDELLRRTVAVKVLPPGRADDDMRRRLTREAQSASALNHPNIVTVYEVGRDRGTDFIAMERIHGRTLRNLIREKGLGLRATLDYAIQIADALAAAHEAGIIHRDLKPGNIMMTERGLVKVLDFGIAKQSVRLDDTATMEESSISRPGEVIGTLSYMSPEQARGKPVDPRSDIFSFGSLLYEMLTGRRAFLEQTALATIEAVVTIDPPALREQVPNIPRGLDRIVSKCMAKKPIDRWQDIADVKLLLQDLVRDLDLPAESPAGAAVARGFGWKTLAAGVLCGALAVWGAIAVSKRGATPEMPNLQMVSSDSGLNSTPAISRDGRFLAFSSDRAGGDNLDIWLQQVGGRDAIRLTSDGADETDPAFSPDGTRVAFRSEKDGGGIYIVPSLGGDPVLLAHGGRNPQFSPDGTTIAYWTGREESTLPGSSHIFVVDAGGGPPRPIQPSMSWAQSPVWAPSGDALLVYGARLKENNRGEWWILPLGGQEPIFVDIRGPFKLSPRITLPRANDWLDADSPRVLFSLESGEVWNLWEVGLTASGKIGTPRRLSEGPGRHLSPSGTTAGGRQRMVYADETVNFDVWALPMDANRGIVNGDLKRITDHLTADWAPSLNASGDRVTYLSRRYGNFSIQSRSLDSPKERTHISDTARYVNARSSADFKQIFFSNSQFDLLSIPTAGGIAEKLCDRCGTVIGLTPRSDYIFYEPKTDEDLLVFDVANRKTITVARRPEPLYLLSGAQVSRDGKWVVFAATNAPARTTEIFVIPFRTESPVPRSEWIPIAGTPVLGRDPDWSPDGSIVYFNFEHDGFRCLGGRRVDPLTKKPSGDIFPVRHFHSARQSLRTVNSRRLLRSLSVTEGRMVFTLADVTGNIWLEEKGTEK